MVTLRENRQTLEALWGLLMLTPDEPLHDGTCEDLARHIAESCGFDHDRAERPEPVDSVDAYHEAAQRI